MPLCLRLQLFIIISGATVLISGQPDQFPAKDRSVHQYSPTLSYKSWREQHIATEVLKNYKGNVRPIGRNESNPKEGGPVIVLTTLYLKSINSINDANMEFSAQFRFQQEWFDERLRFDQMGYREIDWVNFAVDQTIWIPDTFFQNEKRGHYHDVDKPNMFKKLRYDGLVVYNRRMSMTFSCTMDLIRYPHDTQKCQIDFASYAYTTDDIRYEWSIESVKLVEASTSMLPKFVIESINSTTCTSKTNTGEYSCLRVELTLRRVFSFFLLQLYIPSVMLVAVSCVAYWIDWKATAARVPLSIVTLLTMITQSHSINSSLPPVSYTKAIDIWIGACIMFIFSSLIEYAIVNYTGVLDERRKTKLKEKEKSQQFHANSTFIGSPDPFTTPGPSSDRKALLGRTNFREELVSTLQIGDVQSANSSASAKAIRDARRTELNGNNNRGGWEAEERMARRRHYNLNFPPVCNFLRHKGRAERIDGVSRIIFPVMFLGFNCVYWYYYW